MTRFRTFEVKLNINLLLTCCTHPDHIDMQWKGLDELWLTNHFIKHYIN